MKGTKKRMKKITLLVILLMMGNFFVTPIMMSVKALGSDTVDGYITGLNTKVDLLFTKIDETKNGEGYSDNKALVQATEFLANSFDEIRNELNDEVNSLQSGVSLATIINNSGDEELINKYNQYVLLGNVSPTLEVDNLVDITYMVDKDSVLLITAEKIANLIIKEYFTDNNLIISDFLTNYDAKLNELLNSYNTVSTEIDNMIMAIDNYIFDVSSFEASEIAIGNVPNMIINNVVVYDLLNSIKNDFSSLQDDLDLSLLEEQKEIYDDLVVQFEKIKTSFSNNNLDYLALNLDEKINQLTLKYQVLDGMIKNWFAHLGLNYDFNLVSDNLDLDMINYLKEAIDLDDDYLELKKIVDDYLDRKPADFTEIDLLMSNLNDYYDKLNKVLILEVIDEIVNRVDLTVEDNVDLAYNFLSISDLFSEAREKIVAAKLSFYELKLVNEENYSWEIVDGKVLLKGLKNSLLLTDFINNISFNGLLKTTNYPGTLIVDDTLKLNLYDNADNLIVIYDVLIQGDINGDGLLDSNDVLALENLILNKEPTFTEMLLCDINNDGVLTLKDVMTLQEFFIIYQDELATSSSLKLERHENGDQEVYYDIILEANGVVKGLEFSIGTTSDLVFKSIDSDYSLLVDDQVNPNKIVGLGDFKTGLVGRLVYEKNDTKLDQTSMIVSDVILAMGNNNYTLVERLINTVSNVEVFDDDNGDNEDKIISTSNQVETGDLVVDEPTIDDSNDSEKLPDKSATGNDTVTEEEVLWSNVIKIVVIVLLGALIIYFLNKNETDENMQKIEEEKLKNFDNDDDKKNIDK